MEFYGDARMFCVAFQQCYLSFLIAPASLTISFITALLLFRSLQHPESTKERLPSINKYSLFLPRKALQSAPV